jgi:streptogramin lyase
VPTGLAVDSNGKIWVANLETHNAMRINPNAGPQGKQLYQDEGMTRAWNRLSWQ